MKELYSDLKPAMDDQKLDIIITTLTQHSALINSIEEILQSWTEGSGLAVEDEPVEPVLETTHCPSSRHTTKVLELLNRIERNNKLDCPVCSPASLPQPVMQLINKCNVIKRTVLDIKEPPEKVYPLRRRF